MACGAAGSHMLLLAGSHYKLSHIAEPLAPALILCQLYTELYTISVL